MKQLNQYIQEKLHVGEYKKQKYTFDIVENPEHFWGHNWLIDSHYIYSCQAFLLEALESKLFVLRDREKKFIKWMYDDITDYLDTVKNPPKVDHLKATELLNGATNNGLWKRAKCIYDICQHLKKNNVNDLEDEYGNNTTTDREEIIKRLDEVTKGKIKNLDWPHE